MTKETISYVIASWPEEAFVVAEISAGNVALGHVAWRPKGHELTLYPQSEAIVLDLKELQRVLTAIRQRLVPDDAA